MVHTGCFRSRLLLQLCSMARLFELAVWIIGHHNTCSCLSGPFASSWSLVSQTDHHTVNAVIVQIVKLLWWHSSKLVWPERAAFCHALNTLICNTNKNSSSNDDDDRSYSLVSSNLWHPEKPYFWPQHCHNMSGLCRTSQEFWSDLGWLGLVLCYSTP